MKADTSENPENPWVQIKSSNKLTPSLILHFTSTLAWTGSDEPFSRGISVRST